jgi:hypothetical protein
MALNKMKIKLRKDRCFSNLFNDNLTQLFENNQIM